MHSVERQGNGQSYISFDPQWISKLVAKVPTAATPPMTRTPRSSFAGNDSWQRVF